MEHNLKNVDELWQITFENSINLKSLMSRIDRHSVENKSFSDRVLHELNSIKDRQQKDKEELIKEIHQLDSKINEYDKQAKIDDVKMNVKIAGISGSVGALVAGIVSWIRAHG